MQLGIFFRVLSLAAAVALTGCATLEEATWRGFELAQPGDVVLLSPASTSFDRFANFMERGQVFKAIVNELK